MSAYYGIRPPLLPQPPDGYYWLKFATAVHVPPNTPGKEHGWHWDEGVKYEWRLCSVSRDWGIELFGSENSLAWDYDCASEAIVEVGPLVEPPPPWMEV